MMLELKINSTTVLNVNHKTDGDSNCVCCEADHIYAANFSVGSDVIDLSGVLLKLAKSIPDGSKIDLTITHHLERVSHKKVTIGNILTLPWSPQKLDNSSALLLQMLEIEKRAICKAVNNHDRLTAQVEELKAMLESIKLSESLTGDDVWYEEITELLTRIGEDYINIEE